MKFHEHPKRSLLKAVSFRLMVVASDTVIIFLITHKIEATIGLVVATNLASTMLYYLHERFWNQIHWGRALKH